MQDQMNRTFHGGKASLGLKGYNNLTKSLRGSIRESIIKNEQSATPSLYADDKKAKLPPVNMSATGIEFSKI
jgi:hypothetical protein